MSLWAPVIAHDCNPALFALWTLGCDATNLDFFDTRVASQCMHLCRHHHRGPAAADDAMAVERVLRDEHEHLLSLQRQCAHYQLAYPHASTEARLRIGPASASAHPPGASSTSWQTKRSGAFASTVQCRTTCSPQACTRTCTKSSSPSQSPTPASSGPGRRRRSLACAISQPPRTRRGSSRLDPVGASCRPGRQPVVAGVAV